MRVDSYAIVIAITRSNVFMWSFSIEITRKKAKDVINQVPSLHLTQEVEDNNSPSQITNVTCFDALKYSSNHTEFNLMFI